MGRVSDPRAEAQAVAEHALTRVQAEPLSMDEAASFVADRAAGATCVFAGTVRHLTHRANGFADRARDFVVVEAEHLAQHEHRPLVGRERL